MRCYTAINKTCLFEKNWISYYASWMSRVTSNYIALSFTLLSNVTLLRYQGFATCLDFIFNKLWSTTHSIIRLTRESLIIKLKIISGSKWLWNENSSCPQLKFICTSYDTDKTLWTKPYQSHKIITLVLIHIHYLCGFVVSMKFLITRISLKNDKHIKWIHTNNYIRATSYYFW